MTKNKKSIIKKSIIKKSILQYFYLGAPLRIFTSYLFHLIFLASRALTLFKVTSNFVFGYAVPIIFRRLENRNWSGRNSSRNWCTENSSNRPSSKLKMRFGATEVAGVLTFEGIMTNKLSFIFSLELAKRSEAESAKRSFASKIKIRNNLTRSLANFTNN